jgi:hypothetical protein
MSSAMPKTDRFQTGASRTLLCARSHCYAIYGMHVQSDIRLPVVPLPSGDTRPPHLVFRLSEPGRSAPEPEGPVVARSYCEHGDLIGVRSLGPGGNWIQIPGIGMFHIAPNARHVNVYPEAEVEEQILGLVLAGQISIFILYQMGYPCLHASAVLTERGAIAFLGPKGQGKSTMAASFLRRGASLLTDDALPLKQQEDGIYGIPSLPIMKLWRETARCALQLKEELPNLAADLEKKLLTLDGRFQYAPAPARLRAVYVLARYDPVTTDGAAITIQPLRPREAFAAILAQITGSRLLQPAEGPCFLTLYTRLLAQAPVRQLRFPSGFEHEEAVHAQIGADLEAA